MAIPTYDRLLRPLLALATKQEISRRSATDAMALAFGLSVDEREARIPSGASTYIANRTGWAMTFLTKAALIEKVVRGTYRITPAGHEFMTRFPDAIRIADLQAIPGFEDSWGKRAANTSGATGSLEGIVPLAALTSTPEDRIDKALRQLDDVLREELLEAILAKPPRFFEELVLDTLKKPWGTAVLASTPCSTRAVAGTRASTASSTRTPSA